MPDCHNILSKVFHLSHMKFNGTKRFLDPENLCLDTSLADLGVEIVISYKIIIFHQFLTKNHQNRVRKLSKLKYDARNGFCTPKLPLYHVSHTFLAKKIEFSSLIGVFWRKSSKNGPKNTLFQKICSGLRLILQL